jgi:hypothetical protein
MSIKRYVLKGLIPSKPENQHGLVNCAISSREHFADSPPITPPPSAKSTQQAKSDFLEFVYDLAPVVGFRVMKNDVVTVRKARYPEDLSSRLEGAVRGDIEFLSSKSRKRLALIAGNSPVVMRSFVTVTYPAEFPCDGILVKKHFNALLKRLGRFLGPFQYLWFLEFQSRGAPHFHVFLDRALPEPLKSMERSTGRRKKSCLVHWPWQDWISAAWFDIVGSGDEKHLRAGSSWEKVLKPDGAARYVAKESYKTFQKVVPKEYQNVGRFWGCSKGVNPDEGKIVYCSEAAMAKVFPPECFDSSGNPFPVMFSSSEHYQKILGTAKDPDKISAWKSQRKHVTHCLPAMVGKGSDLGFFGRKELPIHAQE